MVVKYRDIQPRHREVRRVPHNIIVSKLKLLSLSFLSALRHRDDGGVFFIDIIRANAHEGLPPYSHKRLASHPEASP